MLPAMSSSRGESLSPLCHLAYRLAVFLLAASPKRRTILRLVCTNVRGVCLVDRSRSLDNVISRISGGRLCWVIRCSA